MIYEDIYQCPLFSSRGVHLPAPSVVTACLTIGTTRVVPGFARNKTRNVNIHLSDRFDNELCVRQCTHRACRSSGHAYFWKSGVTVGFELKVGS